MEAVPGRVLSRFRKGRRGGRQVAPGAVLGERANLTLMARCPKMKNPLSGIRRFFEN